jgi:hypothetical protein
MKLKDIQCRNAKPKKKPYKLSDGGGMYLEIMPSGSKYWRLKYRIHKKEKRLAIGVYPTIPLSEAREKRDAAKKLIRNGLDPVQTKKQAKQEAKTNAENTFKAVALEWHAQNKDRWSENYGYKVLKGLELNVFPFIGERPIADITPLNYSTSALHAHILLHVPNNHQVAFKKAMRRWLPFKVKTPRVKFITVP